MNNAKIYMPFQALKGYEEEIKKASTKKEERKVLLDDRIDALNYILKEIKVNDIIIIKKWLFLKLVTLLKNIFNNLEPSNGNIGNKLKNKIEKL